VDDQHTKDVERIRRDKKHPHAEHRGEHRQSCGETKQRQRRFAVGLCQIRPARNIDTDFQRGTFRSDKPHVHLQHLHEQIDFGDDQRVREDPGRRTQNVCGVFRPDVFQHAPN